MWGSGLSFHHVSSSDQTQVITWWVANPLPTEPSCPSLEELIKTSGQCPVSAVLCVFPRSEASSTKLQLTDLKIECIDKIWLA